MRVGVWVWVRASVYVCARAYVCGALYVLNSPSTITPKKTAAIPMKHLQDPFAPFQFAVRWACRVKSPFKSPLDGPLQDVDDDQDRLQRCRVARRDERQVVAVYLKHVLFSFERSGTDQSSVKSASSSCPIERAQVCVRWAVRACVRVGGWGCGGGGGVEHTNPTQLSVMERHAANSSTLTRQSQYGLPGGKHVKHAQPSRC
jgi:hypothetical protein